MILDVKKFPEDVLKKKALPVEMSDIAGMQRLIDDMIETMYDAHGIGLAAPQVGFSKRVIVIDVSTKEERHPIIVLINPEIVEADGFIDSEEGCLSIPGFVSTIRRAEKVVVKGINRKGEPVKMEGTGLLSRAIQHEIDHLDGILFVDRMSLIKREFFRKKYLKRVGVLE